MNVVKSEYRNAQTCKGAAVCVYCPGSQLTGTDLSHMYPEHIPPESASRWMDGWIEGWMDRGMNR